MVIDFAVDGQHLLSIRAVEGLPTRLRVNDAQPFMGQDGRATAKDSTPVRSAVTDFLTHS